VSHDPSGNHPGFDGQKTFLIIIINVENINLFISLFFNITTNV